VEPLALRGARARARALVEQAERRAVAIVGAAERDAQARTEAARAEGVRRGEEQAARSWAGLLDRAQVALSMSEREVAELSLEIARRFVGEQASRDDAVLAMTLSSVLSRARRARTITVRVHPADVDATRARVRAWIGEASRSPLLEVVADPSLLRGGAVLECDLGRLDATIETRLAALEQALVPG
jgi:flagellar biosynthesis/type III secretory pathway protein FliH